MKNIKFIAIIALFTVFSSCKSGNNRYSENLQTALKGLNKLTVSDRFIDSIEHIVQQNAQPPFPIYSLEGKQMTREDINKKKINITFDYFGDSQGNVKAVVFRDLTEAELKASFDKMDKEKAKQEKAIENLIGKDAPVFSTSSVDKTPLDLNLLRGQVVVLNFWFIHCHACVQEMPELNQIKAEFKDKAVTFIGLTFDKETETKAFLQNTKFDFHVIANAKNIFDQYGIQPCPTTLVIDKTGKVIAYQIGYEPAGNISQAKIRKNILAAL